MKTLVAKPVTARKQTSKNNGARILAICPVNGAGWCPYPFSPAQLKRRLERLAQESSKAHAHSKAEQSKPVQSKSK